MRILFWVFVTTTQISHLSTLLVLSYSITREMTLSMPPSRVALYLHVLRAAYQACHVWGQTLISCPQLQDPSDWGWTKRNQHWQPLWIIRPTISKSLKHFVTCKCKKMCKPPCKCYSAGVKCTTLCTCRGHCFKKDKSCVKIKTSSVLLF